MLSILKKISLIQTPYFELVLFKSVMFSIHTLEVILIFIIFYINNDLLINQIFKLIPHFQNGIAHNDKTI